MNRPMMHKVNGMRIVAKTNGTPLRVGFSTEMDVTHNQYRAHIIDKGDVYKEFYLPLRMFFAQDGNLKTQLFDHSGHFVRLTELLIYAGSKDEKEFSFEISRIDLIRDDEIEKIFKKYELPVFIDVSKV